MSFQTKPSYKCRFILKGLNLKKWQHSLYCVVYTDKISTGRREEVDQAQLTEIEYHNSHISQKVLTPTFLGIFDLPKRVVEDSSYTMFQN